MVILILFKKNENNKQQNDIQFHAREKRQGGNKKNDNRMTVPQSIDKERSQGGRRL